MRLLGETHRFFDLRRGTIRRLASGESRLTLGKILRGGDNGVAFRSDLFRGFHGFNLQVIFLNLDVDVFRFIDDGVRACATEQHGDAKTGGFLARRRFFHRFLFGVVDRR